VVAVSGLSTVPPHAIGEGMGVVIGLRRRMPARAAVLLTATAVVMLGAGPAAGYDLQPIYDGPTPQAPCGPGSLPETGAQGRVSRADVDSGRAALGYRCNTTQVGRFGATGGFRVERYVDATGRECAYFDSTLLFPKDVATAEGPGVYVLDMSNPAKPVKTAQLITPAMLSPHESLRLNVKRGLLAAVVGYPTANPGIVDVYDVSADCRNPQLRSSTPLGVLGHESGFAPDGNTFYVSSAGGNTVTALDLTDPMLPKELWLTTSYRFHGMGISDDGTRLYAADLGNPGVTILDVSQVQDRMPNPQVPVVSRVTWPQVSIPQNAEPITIGGRPYLVEVDEYTSSTTRVQPSQATQVGAARLIDISDETAPTVVSNMRLAVHQTANRVGEQANDPGAQSPVQGYAGHYCSVPTRVDPTIVACSFITSGLRVFDIRDPVAPVEVGYFNAPVLPGVDYIKSGAFAMSAPAFAPARNEIWYSDGNSGFYAVRLATPPAVDQGQTAAAAPAPPTGETAAGSRLAATGPAPLGYLAVLALLVGVLLWRVRAARSRP